MTEGDHVRHHGLQDSGCSPVGPTGSGYSVTLVLITLCTADLYFSSELSCSETRSRYIKGDREEKRNSLVGDFAAECYNNRLTPQRQRSCFFFVNV